MNICTSCGEAKPQGDFAIEGRLPDGNPRYRTQCKKCRAEYVRNRRRSHPEVRLRDGIRTYGLTIEDYESMLENQNGVCAACKQPPSGVETRGRGPLPARLYVDHDHKTGRVRALLCGGCNAAFGMLKDDVSRVEGLLAYAREQQLLSDC